MANKRVLSVQIANRLTRIAEVDYKVKNPRVHRVAVLETPEGVFDDGILTVTPEYVKQIKTTLSQNGMRTKGVIFTIISTKIASREIMIPKVKENKIAALVDANASDYFPIDLSEYELAHLVLDTVRETVDTEKYKVMVLAVAKSLLAGYEKLAQECGLNLVALDYSGNSLYQMVKKECGHGVNMVVRLGERASVVTIVDEAAMVMQRTVSHGINETVTTYLREAKTPMSYDEVLKEMAARNFFEVTEEEIGTPAEAEAEKYNKALSDAIEGIGRVFDYYNSRNPQRAIEKVYLTGLGGSVQGIREILSDRMEMQVELLDVIGDYQFDQKITLERLEQFINCLGAALAPLKVIEKQKEKKDKEEKKFLEAYAVKILVACVAASVVLLLAGLIPYMAESSQNKKKRIRIEELADVIPVYQEYILSQNASNYLNEAYEYTVLPTETLVDFIEEMEQKMPKGTHVTAFAANREGVTFSVVAQTKQQAADVMLQLRTFESLKNIKVTEISDSRGEEGEGKVEFSVSADYVNGKVKSEETAVDPVDDIINDPELME